VCVHVYHFGNAFYLFLRQTLIKRTRSARSIILQNSSQIKIDGSEKEGISES
jgi:hypothetical protein